MQPAGLGLTSPRRLKRWGIIVLAGIFLLLGGAAFGFHMAVQKLKGKVVEGLGEGSAVKKLQVGWSSVELAELSIKGPKGWPAARTLHAERVRIVPSLRSLLTDQIQVASITIENPYLSVLRVPGKLLIVPSLAGDGRGKDRSRNSNDEGAAPSVMIAEIILQNGIMEIFDATVSQPPLQMRLEQIEAIIRGVAPANLGGRTQFDLTAMAKGKTRDGPVKVSGWVGTTGRDSSSHIVMDRVDLVSLQPYIVKRGDARISKGTIDLVLKSEVRNNQLNGVGKIIIRDLEFAPTQNFMATFMGLPRSAVINFLKNNDNAIDVDFTLRGDIRQPQFSLNETLATRVATGMAGQLGVSIQGVAEGLGTLGRKGLEGASGTAEAVGSVFKGLFSGDKNR